MLLPFGLLPVSLRVCFSDAMAAAGRVASRELTSMVNSPAVSWRDQVCGLNTVNGPRRTDGLELESECRSTWARGGEVIQTRRSVLKRHPRL